MQDKHYFHFFSLLSALTVEMESMEQMEIFTSNNIFGTSCYNVRKTIEMMNSSNSCPVTHPSFTLPPLMLLFFFSVQSVVPLFLKTTDLRSKCYVMICWRKKCGVWEKAHPKRFTGDAVCAKEIKEFNHNAARCWQVHCLLQSSTVCNPLQVQLKFYVIKQYNKKILNSHRMESVDSKTGSGIHILPQPIPQCKDTLLQVKVMQTKFYLKVNQVWIWMYIHNI